LVASRDEYEWSPVVATVKTYRDLIAWQRAMDLAYEVYLLSAHFPKEELYGLTRDVRDSATSVPSNIAEGQARTTKDFRHFLSIALGSLQELETQLLLADRLRFAAAGRVEALLEISGEVARLIRGLSSSLTPEA